MKKITLSLFILTFFVITSHADDALGKYPYRLIDGFDFDKKCAHGNFDKSYVNAGLCINVMQLAGDAFVMAIIQKYGASVAKCYSKTYDYDKIQTVGVGIKRLENYYYKNPSMLSSSVVFGYYFSTLNEYPVPQKCLNK